MGSNRINLSADGEWIRLSSGGAGSSSEVAIHAKHVASVGWSKKLNKFLIIIGVLLAALAVLAEAMLLIGIIFVVLGFITGPKEMVITTDGGKEFNLPPMQNLEDLSRFLSQLSAMQRM